MVMTVVMIMVMYMLIMVVVSMIKKVMIGRLLYKDMLLMMVVMTMIDNGVHGI